VNEQERETPASTWTAKAINVGEALFAEGERTRRRRRSSNYTQPHALQIAVNTEEKKTGAPRRLVSAGSS